MSLKVKDVMLACARLLKNEELAAALSAETGDDVETAEASAANEVNEIAETAEKIAAERADMLRAYNIIADELSCEYFPLYGEQTVTVQNGKVRLSELTNAPLKIVSVKNARGDELEYGFSGGSLTVNAKNEVIIKYTYGSREAGENDEFVFTPLPGKFVVAYGMAAQICLENGLSGEAYIWQNKYYSAIRGRAAERRALKIKPRRWY